MFEFSIYKKKEQTSFTTTPGLAGLIVSIYINVYCPNFTNHKSK